MSAIKIISLLILLGIKPLQGSALGGIRLLMTLEQQKKTERIADYLQADLTEFTMAMQELLFVTKNNSLEKRTSLVIDQSFKNKLVSLGQEINKQIGHLSLAFEDIYFDFGLDEVNKEQFEKITGLSSRLINLLQYINQPETLFSIYDQTISVKEKMGLIKSLIKQARTTTDQEIKSRLDTMSVWQWLVGY